MSDVPANSARAHVPWNKGKLVGAKPPLRPKHVWAIRSKLQLEGRKRDLAMFNLGIDSKLRACDVVRLRVDDVAPQGVSAARATVRQRKTGRSVRCELTEQTREVVDEYLKSSCRKSGEYLFPVRGGQGRHMTTRQYARLVAKLGLQHRAKPKIVRHTLLASHEGDTHLSPHWKPPRARAVCRTRTWSCSLTILWQVDMLNL